MSTLSTTALVVLLVATSVATFTLVNSWLIERRNPPVGEFADVGGTRLHYVHVPAPSGADLPPVVFIHGASGNLNDQMVPLRPLLEGRAEMLFVDRPGHGWSERGVGNDTPVKQAATIVGLMRQLDIGRAVIVGHSFGGAVVAALALGHPDSVEGLVFVSAATHPWPGGGTSWYYELASKPVVGPLFAWMLANPGGLMRLDAATTCVFAPNPVPAGYAEKAQIPLVLRPPNFLANAIDVEGLYRNVLALAPRYNEIVAPTVVISGDGDTVVYEELHSLGLARDIPGAELAWVRNLGHKPDWTATDLVVGAIEKVSGGSIDLAPLVASVEARIAADRFGAGCADDPAPTAELAPQ